MRRRFLPYLSTLSIVFMLALSVIYIPSAISQDKSEIIDALDELHDYVSDNSTLPNGAFEHQNNGSIQGKRGALGNKVKAVIHKIESGAYHSAIKKLTNDIGKKAEQWLVMPWETELKDKVQDIIDLITRAPDFSMEASPTSLTIAQGESDTATITITSLNGFSELVDLTVSGVPSDVTATLHPEQVTPPADGLTNSTLTVQVDESATPGKYKLTVTGTSGSRVNSVKIKLKITTVPPSPDFSITIHPSSISIQQGTSDTATIIITSLYGFSDLVTLTVSPVIDGVTYSLDPSVVTPPSDGTITSNITIAVAETATPNNYTLTLTGTSSALQRSTDLSLEITTAPPPPDVEPPTVRIDEPANGSYLAGLVNIVVFMHDKNFKRAELTINDTLIALWTPENVSTGEHSILWDTTLQEYPDDLYNIALTAEDEAGNIGEKTIKVIVDNTSPIIEAAVWTPKEPSIDEQVNVTVKVSDPQPGSDIQNVTLQYRNTTMDDWQHILMSLNVTSGNWTATIPAQSMETTIEFYIEAFDNVGNKAVTDEPYEYEVVAPPGIPLAWIIAIILLILAATATAIYLWRKGRKREEEDISSRA